MFKNLKSISIISIIAFLASCQAEDSNNEEQANEVQLIDETYAVDLESYNDVPIMLNNVEYSIDEVLTNAGLFETYETANTHYLKENLDTKEQVLYVLDSSEEAEKLQAESQRAKGLATNELADINILVKIYDNNNRKGSVWQWSAEGSEELGNDTVIISKNVASARRNKGNSYTVTDNSNSIQVSQVKFFANVNGGGSSIVAGNSANNLSGTSIGNDNIESISYEYGFR